MARSRKFEKFLVKEESLKDRIAQHESYTHGGARVPGAKDMLWTVFGKNAKGELVHICDCGDPGTADWLCGLLNKVTIIGGIACVLCYEIYAWALAGGLAGL